MIKNEFVGEFRAKYLRAAVSDNDPRSFAVYCLSCDQKVDADGDPSDIREAIALGDYDDHHCVVNDARIARAVRNSALPSY